MAVLVRRFRAPICSLLGTAFIMIQIAGQTVQGSSRSDPAEQQRKSMQAVVDFLRDRGDAEGADLIRAWWDRGWIRVGTVSRGSAEFFRPDYSITVRSQALDSVWRAPDQQDYGAIADLASSLVHEMIHAGQFSHFWAYSCYRNSLPVGWGSEHPAESEAYFGTLASMADWVESLRRDLEAERGRPPCEQGLAAKRLKAVCESLLTCEGQIRTMYLASAAAERQKTSAKLTELNERASPLRTQRAATLKRIALAERDLAVVRIKASQDPMADAAAADLEAEIASLGAEAARLDRALQPIEEAIEEQRDLGDAPVLDPARFSWKDRFGQPLTLQATLAQVEAAAARARAVIIACEAARPIRLPVTQLTPEERSDLHRCLCACLGTVGASGQFRPDPVAASASCADPRNGPCIQGNWGCGRFPFPTSGSCFEACCDKVRAEPASVVEEILTQRHQDATSLVSEGTATLSGFFQATSEPQLGRIQRKVRQGDIEKAVDLFSRATAVDPRIAETALKTASAFSRDLVPLLAPPLSAVDFDTAQGLLNGLSALEAGREDLASLQGDVKRWRRDWEYLQDLVPQVRDLAARRQPCAAEQLITERLLPLDQDLRVPMARIHPGGSGFASPFVPMPAKEKLVAEAKGAALNAREECLKRFHPQFKPLQDYAQYKNHPNYAGLSHTQAAASANRILADPALCDCLRAEAEAVLRAAADAAAEQEAKAAQAQQQAIDARRAQAAQLVWEGRACEQRGDLECALGKYEAAHHLLPNTEVAAKIEQLKVRRNQARHEQWLQNEAGKAIREAQALEARGNLKGALGKYVEANVYAPSPQLQTKIASLQAALEAQKAPPPGAPPPPQAQALPSRTAAPCAPGAILPSPSSTCIEPCGDLGGRWRWHHLGASTVQVSKNGDVYVGALAQVSAQLSGSGLKPGDVVFCMRRTSEHCYKGKQLQASEGELRWVDAGFIVADPALALDGHPTEAKASDIYSQFRWADRLP